jgi:hypothetical protein
MFIVFLWWPVVKHKRAPIGLKRAAIIEVEMAKSRWRALFDSAAVASIHHAIAGATATGTGCPAIDALRIVSDGF